jgi:hypothetical protein
MTTFDDQGVMLRPNRLNQRPQAINPTRVFVASQGGMNTYSGAVASYQRIPTSMTSAIDSFRTRILRSSHP